MTMGIHAPHAAMLCHKHQLSPIHDSEITKLHFGENLQKVERC